MCYNICKVNWLHKPCASSQATGVYKAIAVTEIGWTRSSSLSSCHRIAHDKIFKNGCFPTRWTYEMTLYLTNPNSALCSFFSFCLAFILGLRWMSKRSNWRSMGNVYSPTLDIQRLTNKAHYKIMIISWTGMIENDPH